MKDDNEVDRNIRRILNGEVLYGRTSTEQEEGRTFPRLRREARIGKTSPPGFPDRFLACIFSYRVLGSNAPGSADTRKILTHDRLETDSLDKAVAFAARHQSDFTMYRVAEPDILRYYDYSHVEDWLRTRGCREDALRIIMEGSNIEGRHPGTPGRFRFIEIYWRKPSPIYIDPKEAVPYVRCETYEMDIGGKRDVAWDYMDPQYDHETREFYDIEEAFNWAIKYVPNVEAWFPSFWWMDWDYSFGGDYIDT